MNISKLLDLNFQARFIGKDYSKVKNMSIDNGLSREDAQIAEDRIQKAFPKYTDRLEIKYKYNRDNGTTNVDITLYKPDKAVGNIWYKPVLERDYTFETTSDDQVKKLFLNLADKIVEMKEIYLNNLRNKIFEDGVKPYSDKN